MIKKLTLCEECAEELTDAGYSLERLRGGKVSIGACDLCGARRPVREYTARKGTEKERKG